jgi:serine phosphatase RsbU (regulator of sigma subunit)/tetratricopeptide (TPR) repeat protein
MPNYSSGTLLCLAYQQTNRIHHQIIKELRRLRTYHVLILLFLASAALPQDPRVDSLKEVLNGLGQDSLRVNTLNEIAAALSSTDMDESIRFGTEARDLAEQINYPGGGALANKNLGIAYYHQGEYVDALKKWELSLGYYEEQGDKQMIANIKGNMGAAYYTIGKNVEAIEYYLPALKFAEELSDSTRLGTLLLNIGAVYAEQPGTLDSAINYYHRAIDIGEVVEDQYIVGVSTMNLGEVYMEKEQYDSALYYLDKSLTILTDKVYISTALNLMGSIYSNRGDFKNAITYHQDGLEMARKVNAQQQIVQNLLGLASTYENLDNHKKAIENYKEAATIAEETGLDLERSNAYEGLASNYAEIGDTINAYRYLSLQNEIEDIIYRIESTNRTTDLINNYQMEKKQSEITLLQQQAQIDELKGKRQRGITIGIGVVGLLILALAGGLYSRMRFIRRTNEKINAQKQQITDSIAYAQRIQSAILPSEEVMDALLPEHFVLYRPKDIVSGDFYWIKEVQDHLVIVGADCTGHGVPGAFMSVLGITMLNELIGDKCFDAPGAILDRLREKVKQMLVQQGNGDEQKDGMDLAIAIFNRNNRELHFSGANNPLYIIRKKSQATQKDLEPFASMDNGEYRLFELKGDKQPIGTHWEENPFRTTSVHLKEHDSFYMFSDGYIDQFGGEQRKKYKSANFKKLLLSVQSKEMEAQREVLEQEFDRWRGPFEQIDDISVLGVRI